MNKKKTSFVIALVLLIAAALIRQRVNRTAVRPYSAVHGNITVLRLGIVNSFLLKGRNSLVVVDTGEAGNEDRIVSEIRRQGFQPTQVRLIVITHGHLDHYGSASGLRRITGAPIAAHGGDVQYINRGEYAPVDPAGVTGSVIRFVFIDDRKKIEGLAVDIVIGDVLDLRACGIEGKVIATPGHTYGSVSVVLDNGDCIVGDAVMDYVLPDYAVFAQDKVMLRESVRLLAGMKPKRVFLSHGEICSASVLDSILRRDP